MIKLYRFIKPFTVSILAILLLVFLQTLAELYLPTLMSDIVDIGIVNGDTGYIMKIGGLMLLITALGTVCAITASFLSARTSVGFGRILRSKVFSRVEDFSLQEFNEIGTATLITRTTNDINQIQTVTFMILRMMVSAPMMCIGGIIMAVSKDRPLSLCIVVVIPVIIALIAIIISKAMPLFKLMQIKLDKINLVLRENLTGIRVIRAFNRIEREQQRFAEANYDLCQNAIRVNKLMASLMPSMMLVMNFTIIAIIWFGSIRINNGDMQVGSLMAFIQYAMQIMMSLVMVAMMFIMLPRASASAIRINEVLETNPQIKDPEETLSADKAQGILEFKNVSFSFPGAEKPAISNISFTARPGETTALIGGTGSGKTSLINLIPRFYDVDEGSVLVDGVDVREMSQKSLRAKIALVPQKSVLFSGSISDNIRYGKQDASDEEVRRAAEISQAIEFISGMPGGFDAVIEQGGSNVSGGQKQRLSIARALVRRPEIYIFDDSFSALDFKTDARLRLALKKETADATVIVIAQRVTTLMDAGQIIVLEDGRIVGMGTHKELLNSCDVYREIVYSQLSEEELA
ncbi:ABC transporter ATP-binding protein [Syntrophomonas wolfei]|jgi:ATP-binding cassette subfamily B protein|uniref:ABC transporter ATP-binding protein n=1 Tax=Syntrophomonas wolfei TaxID=863 RepID=UPI000773B386|nr:ABC transporter ATP-binding protein [Syntrophomonas wolfei]